MAAHQSVWADVPQLVIFAFLRGNTKPASCHHHIACGSQATVLYHLETGRTKVVKRDGGDVCELFNPLIYCVKPLIIMICLIFYVKTSNPQNRYLDQIHMHEVFLFFMAMLKTCFRSIASSSTKFQPFNLFTSRNVIFQQTPNYDWTNIQQQRRSCVE